jgi:hypothetical protein
MDKEEKQVNLPFSTFANKILHDLTAGRSTSIIGLSNTGKSTLMRGLSSPEAETQYMAERHHPGRLVYVDCNQAVAISAQAFYEIVLRSLLERLGEMISGELASKLRDHHQAVTEAETSFAASLSFNLALTELCEQMNGDLCLLFDEFDEIYAALDDRALLNLRALRDRFMNHLTYVTATIRSLPSIRGRSIEGEFAELFSHTTYPMPFLEMDEANRLLETLDLPNLTTERQKACIEIAGLHPGLLIAVAQFTGSLPLDWVGDLLRAVSKEPQPSAECLKIWGQLTEDEQNALITLAIDQVEGLPAQIYDHLVRIGLVFE